MSLDSSVATCEGYGLKETSQKNRRIQRVRRRSYEDVAREFEELSWDGETLSERRAKAMKFFDSLNPEQQEYIRSSRTYSVTYRVMNPKEM